MDKKTRDFVMAKLHFRNGNNSMAERSVKDHLTTNPEDVEALRLLAKIHEVNNKFDKAFEVYQRCYCAKPDETDVLLKICDLLATKDVNLELSEQRKWLGRATKSYPTHDSVISLKSKLFTLPDDVRSVKAEKQVDDPLSKILEKLSSLEIRLERIEEKLDKNVPAPSTNASTECKTKPNVVNDEPNVVNDKPNVVNEKPNVVNEKPPSIFENRPPKNVSFEASSISKENTPAKEPVSLTPSLFSIPKPSTPTTMPALDTNLFASGLSKLSLNTSGNLFSANFGSNTLTNNITPDPVVSKPSPAPENPTPSLFTGFNLSSPFTFSTSPSQQGGNLFAQSMAKFNINAEGSYSSPSIIKPFSQSKAEKEQEKGKDEEEFVPNEELPIENTCDMTPIELKTGEENEDVLFEQRCKLFRLRDGEWKERGIGYIKVLKHKESGKGRLIMRREATGIVSLNCWDLKQITRVKENSLRWGGVDASEEAPTTSAFLARFKTAELTDQFISILKDLYPDEKSNSVSTRVNKPDVELIYPKLDESLVEKARKLQLPDLFYHTNQDPCKGCDGCEKDEN